MSAKGDRIRVLGYDPIADAVDEAWDKIEKVLELHKPVDAGLYFKLDVCDECAAFQQWPCDTVQILTGGKVDE